MKIQKAMRVVLHAYSIVEEPYYRNTKYSQDYEPEPPYIENTTTSVGEYLAQKLNCTMGGVEDVIQKCVSRGWLELYYPYKHQAETPKLHDVYRVRLTSSGWNELEKNGRRFDRILLIVSVIVALASLSIMVIQFVRSIC